MRLQRLAWAIGRMFCEIPSDQLDRTQKRLDAEVYLLKMHVAECERRHRELEQRLDRVNADRLGLIQQITKTEEPPGLWLIEEEG